MTIINANGKSYDVPAIFTADNGAGHSKIIQAGTGEDLPTLFAVMVDLVADADAAAGGAGDDADAAAASALAADASADAALVSQNAAASSASSASTSAGTATTQAGISTAQAVIATAAAAGIGYSYTYSTTTTASDPGAGFLRFNNAALASATALYISETTALAQDVSAYLATWDDPTSTIKGRLKVTKQSDTTVFALFNITGTITDGGAWDTFTVAYVSGSGALANSDAVTINFIAAGDKGDAGAPYDISASTTETLFANVLHLAVSTGSGSANNEKITPANFFAALNVLVNMVDNILQRPELKDYSETHQTVAAASTTTLDFESGNVITLTQDTNITTFTWNNPSPTGKACSFTLRRVKDATGTTRTIAWPASVKWAAGSAPTLSQTTGAVDVFSFFTLDAGTTWYGFVAGQAMA
jgi:hypothetical protein